MANEISKLIKEMRSLLSQAETHEDLQKVVQLAIDYGKPVKYNNTPFYIATLVLLAVVLATLYFCAYGIVPLVISILCSLIPLCIGLIRRGQIKKLEKDIFLKDAFIDNRLVPAEAPSLSELDGRYTEFVRGNDRRDIEYYMDGRIQKEEYELEYSVYKFHYVVRKTSTDSKGKTETTYSHYYRYGVFLKNFTMAGLHVMSSTVPTRYETKWTTPSIKFNKLFKVHAANELAAAKFLKPVIVLKFEEFIEEFPKTNVEVDLNNCLCISFDKHDLLDLEITHTLEDPQAFMDAMQGSTTFTKLSQVLDFLYTLMIKTDNNFRED